MKNRPAKFEINAEKPEVFANHSTFCFTSVEEDNEYIEHADKTSNEFTNEQSDRITSTSPVDIYDKQ